MFQVLFYISAVFVGWWMGENLQLAPLLVIFVVGGFVVYGLLRNTEGLAAIRGMLAGVWSAVCFVSMMVGYYRSTQQTAIGDFLQEYIFR
jgi:EamA domain-containing membrane protein RarD